MSDLIARLEELADTSLLCSRSFWDEARMEVGRAMNDAADAIRELNEDLETARRGIKVYCDSFNEAKSAQAAAEAQLSALRDQQPVARVHFTQMGIGVIWVDHRFLEEGQRLYAHPSCVSPDKPQRPADSNESADHPVDQR